MDLGILKGGFEEKNGFDCMKGGFSIGGFLIEKS